MSDTMAMPDQSTARGLLVTLVETPSVSGEEKACTEQLVTFFENHDREVWTDEVGNVHAPADDGVLLTSHIDTVPGTVPVRVAETENGNRALWGRGSVDAKGSLVAMAVAAVQTGASFLGVVGEETDSRGARHAVDTRDAPDAVINGEPSGWDAITLGYRGIVTATYTLATDTTHTAGPDSNAIQEVIDWYTHIEHGLTELASDTETFECVTGKPVAIDGSPSDDGMTVETTIEVEFRLPPGESVTTLQQRIESMTDSGSIEWTDGIEPVMESPRTPVARAFRVAIRDAGGDPDLLRKTGTSDMNVFAKSWDCPMVTYGPGDSTLDHTPNEHLVLSELDRAVDVLTAATEQLLASNEPTEQTETEP
ncbi:[LysW]-lysine hydrolase [Halovenus rubra]|uniref:[LysW]-lysine hydrolase n=2 Tax=Halovenus rubra TaxID=869890 RepID=A0ACC7E2N9_9EURY|nr:[LysW]-lysine hydrolase [Halovenus rubra]